jgi:hypothetical protein
MSESDWLNSADPKAMLIYLRNNVRIEDRAYRLFALACCRRILADFPTRRNQLLLELAEGYIDTPDRHEAKFDELAFKMVCHGDSVEAAAGTADFAARAVNEIDGDRDERRAQAEILRQIVGNPFDSSRGLPTSTSRA